MGRAEERQETREQRPEVKGEGGGKVGRDTWDQVSAKKGKGGEELRGGEGGPVRETGR